MSSRNVGWKDADLRGISNLKLANRCITAWPACLLALLFLVNLLACGGGFGLPSPTTKSVAVADLVGVWHYQPEAGVTVTLELFADGRYVQNVNLPGSVKRASGQWQLDGSDVRFDAVYNAFDKWQKPGPQTWMIVDRDGTPPGVALFGGAVDPDMWMQMTWSALPSSPSTP